MLNPHDWHCFLLKLLLTRFLSDSRALCCFVFRWSSNTRIWSNYSFADIFLSFYLTSTASTGNRTRAAHVASEHSTTEPSMRLCSSLLCTKKFLENTLHHQKNICLAERSFNLRTSGLWAQHASAAPLCLCLFFKNRNWFQKNCSSVEHWRFQFS